jgi:hypothetical protein
MATASTSHAAALERRNGAAAVVEAACGLILPHRAVSRDDTTA